jgi:hypothetical protein
MDIKSSKSFRVLRIGEGNKARLDWNGRNRVGADGLNFHRDQKGILFNMK